MTCAKSAGGRPIAGALTFGSGDVEISRHTVRLAAHQIAHALGFSYNEMNSRNMIVDKTVRGKTNQLLW
ncbi:leishmanolysin-related zinc metalloendopeptidase [Streptomyces hygroscopicus]|uniref:leishmanolysin-related zinc metalloendopeptidase n=1 Tax=Streptomyces hygroscopicus TaxID=1912 RepID=UPI003F1C7D7D